jgi:hypothetical protein
MYLEVFFVWSLARVAFLLANVFLAKAATKALMPKISMLNAMMLIGITFSLLIFVV